MYCSKDTMDRRIIVNVFALDAILFLILNPTLGKVLPYTLIERHSSLPLNYISIIDRIQRSPQIMSNIKEGAPTGVRLNNRSALKDGSVIIKPMSGIPTEPENLDQESYGEENFDLSVIPLQKPFKTSSEESSEGLQSRL